MHLNSKGQYLTYCINVHPTQTWREVEQSLIGPVKAVKEAVCADMPFAVGLRFSADALAELQEEENRSRLKQIIAENDFLAITVNGFPYGPFHGTSVKEDVYQPDWRTKERIRYTCELANLMAEIAPSSELVSLSTVPGTFKPLADGNEREMAENYVECVAHLVKLERDTGVQVALAIEPEPFCFLETIEETVAYFRDYLFSDEAARLLARLCNISDENAARLLPRHLGLCYDVCHAAVEYEDPGRSILMLREAGIPVHKLQISAALRVPVMNERCRLALQNYDEPTYLHQVVRRDKNGIHYHKDLQEALELGNITDGEEWRVHFHVPVFMDDLGAFNSTRTFLEEILALHVKEPISQHLEVETYTWDVLPENVRSQSVEQDVAKELNWVRNQLSP